MDTISWDNKTELCRLANQLNEENVEEYLKFIDAHYKSF